MRAGALVLVVAVLVPPAGALTPGGGGPKVDCLAEFGGVLANYPASRPREIRCMDNDPTCDSDPTPGRCGIGISVCLNVTDPLLPACPPATLTTFATQNEQPDTNPKHDFAFQTLQDSVNSLFLPLSPAQTNRCTTDGGFDPVTVTVPLKLAVGARHFQKGVKVLRSVLTGTANGAPVRDADRLRITCLPGPDPCAGVTGTFDQIQEQVFALRCALPTCHVAVQPPHEMSLKEGEAYANLVNLPAHNATAAAAGLDRVLPGDPTHSFIVLKLRGLLASGEGARMPLGGPYLDGTAIQLVADWITAGAPADGWVGSPEDCPHP